MKQRIWELDAFRGLCVLGMIAVHLIFDLAVLYRVVHWEVSAAFTFVQNWGGVLFLLLSGICATLGKRSFRRGLVVFSCGLLCTAVTAAMYLLRFADRYIIIRFGVLHCLGACMMLWPLVRKLPAWVLAILSALIIGAGLWFATFSIDATWLYPLGLTYPKFSSADYFPLLPNFGFFLLGSILGRRMYPNRQSLWPNGPRRNPATRFLEFCGRHSLFIYLLHQPLLALVCQGLALL